jgi:hypothetical protein
MLLGTLVVVLNLAIYGWALRRYKKRGQALS